MKTKATIAILFACFLQQLVFSQTFFWEKIEDALVNGDSICYAFSGGFPIGGPEPTLFNLDGSLDFFIGTQLGNGAILHLQNTGDKETPCWVVKDRFFGNVDVSPHRPATLYFADIVGDSLPDLITGRSVGGGSYGNLSLYENVSTENEFLFELVTDTLFGITFYDYADPCAKDVDKDGDIDFVIGNGLGQVFFIRNLGGNQWGNVDTLYNEPGFENDKASPELGDFIGNDSIPELLVGDASGTLKLFRITHFSQDTVIWGLVDDNYIPEKGFTNNSTGRFVNPMLARYDEDELADLVLASRASNEFVWLKNAGSLDSAIWEPQGSTFPLNNFPVNLFFSAGDIDNDSIPELLFLVNSRETLALYTNEAPAGEEPNWVFHSNSPVDSVFLSNTSGMEVSSFVLYDIDGDGFRDVVAASNSRQLMFFRKVPFSGNYQFEYVQDTILENIILAPPFKVPAIGDFDFDGNPDMLVYTDGEYAHYEFQEAIAEWEKLNTDFDLDLARSLSLVDFDEDGRVDIISSSGFNFYKNVGDVDSLAFELQEPVSDYRPNDYQGPLTNIIFGDFDGQCGKDIIQGTQHGVLLWGSRGIKPRIIYPAPLDSFGISQDTIITLAASPPNGFWEGDASPDGTFNPSFFSPGEYQMIYTYESQENCIPHSDTLLIKIILTSTRNHYSPIRQLTIGPNPTSGQFFLNFDLTQPGQVSISLISLLGQEFLLQDSYKNQGECHFTFERPKPLSAGLYFVKIRVDGQVRTERIVLK